MAWEVKIEKIANGYVASYQDEIDEGVVRTEKFCFEESFDAEYAEEYKTKDEEKIAFAKMISWLYGHFGELYNKYGEENLKITFDGKGHKL